MDFEPVARSKNRIAPMPTRRQPGENLPDWREKPGEIRAEVPPVRRLICFPEKDVEWVPYTGPRAEENRRDSRCAELESGEPGCRSRGRWQVLDKSQMSETDTVEFVLGADQSPSAKTGHPFCIFICIFFCIFFFFYLSEPPRAPCARRTPFRNNSISSAIAAPPIISTSDNPRSNAPVNWIELRCDDASPGNLVVRYSGGGLRFTLGLRSAV